MSYIALSPPLPCVAPGLGPHGRVGFVQAISPDSLRIAFQMMDRPSLSRPTTAKGPKLQTEITVTLGDQQAYCFTVELVSEPAGTDAVEVFVREDSSLAKLTDLLNLVRKSQHIALCESVDVEASDRYTGFEEVTLLPKAFPELSWNELQTEQMFLGRRHSLPILITGMTGGLTRGAEINRHLALAAEHFQIPMGVGSQRVALENPEHAAIFSVKRFAPKVFLIGNLGVAQLRGKDPVGSCRRAVDMIGADAMALHINVLQEVIQVEGDRDFRGLLDRIHEVVEKLGVPVLVKEVGAGMDPDSARLLAQAGVTAIDCGGKGGTSWSYIEGMRADSEVTQEVGKAFRDWGIPTAFAIRSLKKATPNVALVATGGIRSGPMVAKALALGANMVGLGLPIFRAALVSEAATFKEIEKLQVGLKTAMIAVGAKSIHDLRRRVHVSPRFLSAMAQYTEPTNLDSEY